MNHAADYPYVQSQHQSKKVVFNLRSKKTYSYQPILLVDRYEKDKLVLPLIVGDSIDGLENCEVLPGYFS